MSKLPTFLVSGVAKRGAASLHYFMEQDPEVCIPPCRETYIFCRRSMDDTFPAVTGSGEHEYTELGLDDQVRLAGRSDRVEEYLRPADLFVFASRQETFGISLIEAMACGLPSVAAKINDVSTDIVDHGTDGLLVPQDDPGAFAAAVVRLLDDPEEARAIGRSAAEKVRAKFSIESISRKHRELYEELLS